MKSSRINKRKRRTPSKNNATSQHGNRLKDGYSVNIIQCVEISFKGCTEKTERNFMMNILEELYYGTVGPCKKCFDTASTYAEFCRVIAENEKSLNDFLAALPNAEKERHLFSQMTNAQGAVSDFSEKERFIEGFRMGARFILDMFVMPDNSVIRDIV